VIGQSLEVLFENRNEGGLFEGFTSNYIRVGVATNEELRGQIRKVRIEKVAEGLVYGFLQG
jgi:threonylcarbamoyladenosine tRNA methylthiotransferase MtaB